MTADSLSHAPYRHYPKIEVLAARGRCHQCGGAPRTRRRAHHPLRQGRENVLAGTDCGFAQGPFYRHVHPSIMWAKLEALAEGARSGATGIIVIAELP
jgi:hypothetical protein